MAPELNVSLNRVCKSQIRFCASECVSSKLSYDAEFRLFSDVSNNLTSPEKNSSLFGNHLAAMLTVVGQLVSFSDFRFRCALVSASFWTEIFGRSNSDFVG